MILHHFFSSAGVQEFISFFSLESVESGGGGGGSSTFGLNGVRCLFGFGVRNALSSGGGMGGGQKGVRFLLGVDIGKVCALGSEINFGLTKFVLCLLVQI